jgi:AcrR family transcriptional regulator
MGKRMSSTDRREQIIDTALGQLAANGFDATSVASVAAELGIDRVIIYRQFSDFHELFRAVVEHVGELIDDAVDEAIGAGAEVPIALGAEVHGDTRARAVLSSLLAAARARPEVWRFLRNPPSSGDARLQVAALNDAVASRLMGQIVTDGNERGPEHGYSAQYLAWGAAFLYNGALGAFALQLDNPSKRTDAEFVAFVSFMIRRVVT